MKDENQDIIEDFQNMTSELNDRDIDTILASIEDSHIRDEFDIGMVESIVYEEVRVRKEIEKSPDKSTLQRYFDDIGFVYKRNDENFNIEYSQDNRDRLIEMNLKSVIKIAKRYRGMGLSLEELISAGNEGLCVAFDKYNPNKSALRDRLLDILSETYGDIDSSWIDKNIGVHLKYGNLKQKYQTFMNGRDKISKQELEDWISNIIRPATFNSVAMLWVAAYIRQELNIFNDLIKGMDRDAKSCKKSSILNIDTPLTDSNTTLKDVLNIDYKEIKSIDIEDTQRVVHDLLLKLLRNVCMRDRRILFQRFGIGYVRPLLPKEIGETERLSPARISQIINRTLEKMRHNARVLNIDISLVYSMLEDISE